MGARFAGAAVPAWPLVTLLLVGCPQARSQPPAALGGSEQALESVSSLPMPDGIPQAAVHEFAARDELIAALSEHDPALADAVATLPREMSAACATLGVRGETAVLAAVRLDQPAAAVPVLEALGSEGGEGGGVPTWAYTVIGGRAAVAASARAPDGATYLLLAGAPSEGAALDAMSRLRSMVDVVLPETIGDWALSPDVRRYDERTIFDYIDGHAETHVRYAFRRMTRGEYASGPHTVIVEVYDMGSAADAFGLNNVLTRTEPIPPVRGSQATPSFVRFHHGPYYCEVRPKGRDADAGAILEEVAWKLSLALGPPGPEPEVVQLLAGMPTPPAEVRYFHRFQDVSTFYYLSTSDVLNLSPLTEGVIARTADATQGPLVLAVRYASVEDRAKAREDLWGAMRRPGDPMPADGEPYEWDAGLYVATDLVDWSRGPVLVAVLDAPSADEARSLLAGLVRVFQ